MIKNIFKIDKKFTNNEIINGYKIETILGQGRFGIAYLGSKGNEKVVIKQLKNNMLEKTKDKLKYEESILSKIDDERFPKFIGKFNKDNKKGYILEYKDGITFEKDIYINKRVFTKEEIYHVGSQLIDIIKYLDDKNIVHKDIRVSNVIIGENQKIYLIDFGLARYINNENYKKDMDYWYLADFLIHLYYTSYNKKSLKDRPWYEELDLRKEEILFLKKLMGIEATFEDIKDIESEFNNLNKEFIR